MSIKSSCILKQSCSWNLHACLSMYDLLMDTRAPKPGYRCLKPPGHINARVQIKFMQKQLYSQLYTNNQVSLLCLWGFILFHVTKFRTCHNSQVLEKTIKIINFAIIENAKSMTNILSSELIFILITAFERVIFPSYAELYAIN